MSPPLPSASPSRPRADVKPSWRKRTPRSELALFGAWVLALAFVSWCFQVMTRDTIWAFVTDAPRQAADIGSRMVPPDWAYTRELLWPLWETLNIATLGTLIGLVLATPVAFLAARNTTPSVALVRPVALLVIVSSRSINSLIWALLLVAILGPGPLAGVFAIALRSIGFIGKLLYEAIEEIDARQVEAIEAAGASRAQVMGWGVVPQVAPTLAGITVFRWDINIRESTVLGLVGAGGIGVKLEAALGSLAWPKVTMLLLAILATVVVSEWISARVRRHLI
jgi:phosphonate transport system permease protein